MHCSHCSSKRKPFKGVTKIISYIGRLLMFGSILNKSECLPATFEEPQFNIWNEWAQVVDASISSHQNKVNHIFDRVASCYETVNNEQWKSATFLLPSNVISLWVTDRIYDRVVIASRARNQDWNNDIIRDSCTDCSVSAWGFHLFSFMRRERETNSQTGGS